ncbi:unknown [Dialister sp. CAG:357]|nr:unknown [Dialister sp. CAG:357]
MIKLDCIHPVLPGRLDGYEYISVFKSGNQEISIIIQHDIPGCFPPCMFHILLYCDRKLREKVLVILAG